MRVRDNRLDGDWFFARQISSRYGRHVQKHDYTIGHHYSDMVSKFHIKKVYRQALASPGHDDAASHFAGTLWAPAENPWRSTSQCSLYVTSQAGSASHRLSTVGSAVTHNSCSLSVWINHPVIPLSSVVRTEARLRRDSDEVKKAWLVWLKVVAVVHLSQEDHPS